MKRVASCSASLFAALLLKQPVYITDGEILFHMLPIYAWSCLLYMLSSCKLLVI